MPAANRILPPQYSVDHPLYQVTCRFALGPSVTGLLEMATAAGWDEEQIALAVITLVSMHIDPVQHN